MRVLVTGASGFIGVALCRALLERGNVVRAMVRNAAARQAALRLGLEETIECSDSELVETKAADRGEDDATEDVAVDLGVQIGEPLGELDLATVRITKRLPATTGLYTDKSSHQA